MNIGIVGSRRRTRHEDFKALYVKFGEVLRQAGDAPITIVSGGCPTGADYWAESIAEDLQCQMIVHEPDWQKYGKVAGLVRNEFIARDADILIACVAEDRTGGTEDTIKKFKAQHPDGQVILV